MRGRHGESCRGVEGVAARTEPIGRGYTSDRRAGHRQSIRIQEYKTNAFDGGAEEDGCRPEGPMGEGEGSEGVPASTHHESGRTQQDRRSTARPLGQGKGTANEGGLVRLHPD